MDSMTFEAAVKGSRVNSGAFSSRRTRLEHKTNDDATSIAQRETTASSFLRCA